MSTEMRICRNCNGYGAVKRRKYIFFVRTVLCPACGGTGRTPDRPARSTRVRTQKDEAYWPPLAPLDPYFIPSVDANPSPDNDFHGKGGAFGGGGADGSWPDERPHVSHLEPVPSHQASHHRDDHSSSHHHSSDYGHHSSGDSGSDSGGGGGSDGGSSGGD